MHLDSYFGAQQKQPQNNYQPANHCEDQYFLGITLDSKCCNRELTNNAYASRLLDLQMKTPFDLFKGKDQENNEYTFSWRIKFISFILLNNGKWKAQIKLLRFNLLIIL